MVESSGPALADRSWLPNQQLQTWASEAQPEQRVSIYTHLPSTIEQRSSLREAISRRVPYIMCRSVPCRLQNQISLQHYPEMLVAYHAAGKPGQTSLEQQIHCSIMRGRHRAAKKFGNKEWRPWARPVQGENTYFPAIEAASVLKHCYPCGSGLSMITAILLVPSMVTAAHSFNMPGLRLQFIQLQLPCR